MQTQQNRPIAPVWAHILHRLFDHPAVVLIGGVWKSGKTDCALYIAECLQRLKLGDGTIVSEVASNIDTKGTYPIISDTISLRQWLYSSTKRKLYIFDELNEHLASRRAMTTKNVGFVSLIPEISKAHGRLLMIGHQLLSVDKTFLDDIWCRGVIIKTSLKTAHIISQLLNAPTNLTNIPPTTIKFDPYAIAPFTEKPAGGLMFKDKDKQVLYEWVNGKSCKALGLHPMQLNRMIKHYVAGLLDMESHISHS